MSSRSQPPMNPPTRSGRMARWCGGVRPAATGLIESMVRSIARPEGYGVAVPAITSILPSSSAVLFFPELLRARRHHLYRQLHRTHQSRQLPGYRLQYRSGLFRHQDDRFFSHEGYARDNGSSNASEITYGQALADSILSGGTPVCPEPLPFLRLPAYRKPGNQGQSVVFTPSDTGKYLPVTLTVPVTVGKANPVLIALPNATSFSWAEPRRCPVWKRQWKRPRGSFPSPRPEPLLGSVWSSHEICSTPLIRLLCSCHSLSECSSEPGTSINPHASGRFPYCVWAEFG